MIDTKSIWEGTSDDLTSYPELTGEHETDIAIVGGGISGLTAALLLSNSGKKIILLEARSIGLGTTGNSTGNLYATVDEHLSGIKKKWNADVMKAVSKSRQEAIDFIEQQVTQNNIGCNFSRQPFSYYAESLDKKIEEFLKDEFDALKECGLNPQLLDNAGLPFKTVKALRADNQAQFHPLKYVQALAKVISGKCSLHENSRVIDIDEKEGILKTANAKIKANKILLATHTPVGVFMVHTVLAPYREFGVAAEINDSTFPGGIYWGLNDPKHSIRLLETNGKKYVMAIGDKFKTGQHGDTQQYIKGLENYLKQRFNISETKFIWGGQQYRSADGLPYIGKHSDHIYFLTGFATDGLIYGTLAAMIISDQILGKKNQWEDVYRADRFTPLKSAKDFIVENTDNFVQYMKDIPWNVDDKEISEIRAGEAKVIEKDQEKLAIYRNETGELHVVSAVCTHMKCIVNWNQSEKSWDCPCHGSRFDFKGEVIEGPAIVPLPKKKTNKD